MTSAAADVIVVGAGGSGAPLAARLAARGARVLLLEWGPVPAPFESRDASSLAGAMPGDPLAVGYAGVLVSGRDHTVVRGRAAGGSTAINGGYFRRARERDLDAWATIAGDARWSAAATSPLWSRIEHDHEFGHAPGHGTEGPMPVTRAPSSHPLSAALLAAGEEAGLPLVDDQNASPELPPGIGSTPTNVLRGERWSTARAFLDPVPPGVELRGGHEAIAIVIDRRGRATGVEVLAEGQRHVLEADLVVLCAGAIETPRLLVRSGIGSAEALAATGVPVVLHAPVGAQLHDHPQVALRFTAPASVLAHAVEAPLGVSAHGSSGLADELGAGGGVGDLEVLSVLRPLGRMLGTEPDDHHLSLLVSPLQSTGRGELRFDDSGRPVLDFHYLSTEPDRARMRAAVRLATVLLENDALRLLGARSEHPHLAALDDAELDEWMLARLSTALHTCGTTPMGTDPATSVVDGRGAVHGVEGLYIADVGLLPSTPTSGPAATAVLIGEVIADALCET